MWSGCTLIAVLLWGLAAWLANKSFQADFGWHSALSPQVGCGVALACVILAGISSARRLRAWPDMRASLRSDLVNGCVIEECYRFVAVKRFQEPEHGGLIYLFLTDDNRVFTRYDQESQDLGVQNREPLDSTFEARSGLLLLRAPNSRFVIDQSVSGNLLDAGSPYDLTVPPDRWPEQEEYCELQWSELETWLSKAP